MLLVQQGHYNAVMIFPEVTISSSWPKSDQFASKSTRAGCVTAKAFWVTPYLAMAEPTHGSGSQHGTHRVLLLTGEKGPEVLLLLQQTHTAVYALSRNTPLDIWEMKEQQNSVIPPNRGNVF